MSNPLLRVYRDLDRQLAEVIAEQPYKSPCSRGCSACCRGMNVTVHIVEALQVVEYAWRKHGEAYVYGLGPQLYQQSLDLANRHTTAATWKVRGEPCPLLGDDNACRVYEARPMQCRAWVSFDEREKCYQPGGQIRSLDNSWPIEKMLVPMQRWSYDAKIPPSYGPLQFQMLLALLIGAIGREAYAHRVAGTTLAGLLSAIPWMHIEDEERQSRARRLAWEEMRKTGVRLMRPQEVLDWPELREIGGAAARYTAAP